MAGWTMEGGDNRKATAMFGSDSVMYPGRRDQQYVDLNKVLEVARKLEMFGILDNTNEEEDGGLLRASLSPGLMLNCQSSPRPQQTLTSRNMESSLLTEWPPSGRSRNQSLPDASVTNPFLRLYQTDNSYRLPPRDDDNYRPVQAHRGINIVRQQASTRHPQQGHRQPCNPYANATIGGECNNNMMGFHESSPPHPPNPYALHDLHRDRDVRPQPAGRTCGRTSNIRSIGFHGNNNNNNTQYQNNNGGHLNRPCTNTTRSQRGNGQSNHLRCSTDSMRRPSNASMPLSAPGSKDFFSSSSAGEQSSLSASTGNTWNEMDVIRSFGDYGTVSGQFNMPQGLCLGLNEEIIVADTLNHRIQIFDKSGRFIFLWGCPGVGKGQLWHPRKIAFIPGTEHVVISDRVNGCSRIQIFERTGRFIRTIGNLHGLRMALNTTTAGLTVYNNHIIVVEVQPSSCAVVTEDDTVVYWFTLDGIMQEPSDVVVINQKHYISDFRDHCVCVFNNWGHLLQRLDGSSDSVIRYPRGLGVSEQGHLLVADTDLNRFHISVWNANSCELISYHSLHDLKVSHSCGVVMNSLDQVITAVKKDHRVLMLKFKAASHLNDTPINSLPAALPTNNLAGLIASHSPQRRWNVDAPSFQFPFPSRILEVQD